MQHRTATGCHTDGDDAYVPFFCQLKQCGEIFLLSPVTEDNQVSDREDAFGNRLQQRPERGTVGEDILLFDSVKRVLQQAVVRCRR